MLLRDYNTVIYMMLFILVMLTGCNKKTSEFYPKGNSEILKKIDFDKALKKLVFGSCNKEWKAQSYWQTVTNEKADIWIWLGDIIYADTEDMKKMKEKYERLKGNVGYRQLRRETPIIGIWDDHDYGVNDGGKEYPKKDSSKSQLFDFLDVPRDNPARSRSGAYQSYVFGPEGQQIKIILLDTRYFRDRLVKNTQGPQRYVPNQEGTILGEEQWSWLKEQLVNSQSQINIIASGIQVLQSEQYFEKWENFPNEKSRLLDLLSATDVANPLLISGDRHISELMKYPMSKGRDMYEITSSGLTHSYEENNEPNQFRYGPLIKERSYAVVNIDWQKDSIALQLQFKDLLGKQLFSYGWSVDY